MSLVIILKNTCQNTAYGRPWNGPEVKVVEKKHLLIENDLSLGKWVEKKHLVLLEIETTTVIKKEKTKCVLYEWYIKDGYLCTFLLLMLSLARGSQPPATKAQSAK